MKPAFWLIPLLLTLAGGAQAADRTLSCVSTMGGKGKATLTVMTVENHPELFVAKIDLTAAPIQKAGTPPAKGDAHLTGLLAGSLGPEGSVMIQGVVSAAENSEVILNPESITLQGWANSLDEIRQLTLMDEGRHLQLGFGLYFDCR